MGKIKQWFNNSRPQSLVQSVMPAIVALVLGIGMPGFNFGLGLVAIIGVIFAHLAMNLADDYFDYKVDMHSDRDRVIRKGFRAMTMKYPYLTDGSESPKTTLCAIVIMLAVAALCGAMLCLHYFFTAGILSCLWIVGLALATCFLGIFYSAPPLKLAYRGLGEPIIGFIFGPMLMMGVYYSACGTINSEIVFLSFPIGMLVMNILYTHSFLEIHSDEESNKMTLARLINSQSARLTTSYIIIWLPLVIIVAAAILGLLPLWYALVVLPYIRLAFWLCSSLKDYSNGLTTFQAGYEHIVWPIPRLNEIKESGLDWFLIRWFAARNLLSRLCLALIIIKILICVI